MTDAVAENPVEKMTSTERAEALAQVKSGAGFTGKPAEAKAAETKPEPKAEKSETKAETKVEAKSEDAKAEAKETDPVKLQAQIDGLHKEIGRLRTDRRETHGEEKKLIERIAKLEGMLEQQEKTRKESGQKSVKDFGDDDLISLETEWTDMLADAKAAGDTEKVQKAKANISAIKKELYGRSKESAKTASTEENEAEQVKGVLTEIGTDLHTAFPELAKQDSALWKAANEQYGKLPKKLQNSGIVGDLMAVVRAVAKHPELLGGSEKKAEGRKELLNNLEKAAEKSLSTGATGGVNTMPDFAASTADQRTAAMQRLKSGQPLAG